MNKTDEKRRRLTPAQRKRVDLLERVIDAIGYDWPPGLTYLMVLEYCARRSRSELLELQRSRRRLQRKLGTKTYCLARSIYSTDQAIHEWLAAPAIGLGGRRPQDLLATMTGSRQVERLLQSMAHGVPS